MLAAEAGLPPRIDFDAIFVPDVQEHLALIAPQLAYHGLGCMRLLGTSSWHTPALAAAAGVRQQLEGAVFTTHFDAGRALPFVQAFRGAHVTAWAGARVGVMPPPRRRLTQARDNPVSAAVPRPACLGYNRAPRRV